MRNEPDQRNSQRENVIKNYQEGEYGTDTIPFCISPKTHCFPQVPKYYTDKPEDQPDQQKNEMLNEETDFSSSEQPIYDSLIRARIEIETWLTTQDLIKNEVVSRRIRANASNTINMIYPRLNIRSIVCIFARNCFSHHIALLKSAIEKRKRITRLLGYFQPFMVNGMVTKIHGVNIDLRKIVDECIEKDTNDADMMDENETVYSEANSARKEEAALKTLLDALKITRLVKITVDYIDLHFVCFRRIETIHELKKMLDVKEDTIYGKLIIKIEIIKTKNGFGSNDLDSLKSEYLGEKNVKDHLFDNTVPICNNKLSQLICDFCYFGLISNSFKKIEFFEIIAIIRAKQFFGHKKFIRLTIIDKHRSRTVRWTEEPIIFAYISDGTVLNVCVRGNEMDLRWKSHKIEILESDSNIE